MIRIWPLVPLTKNDTLDAPALAVATQVVVSNVAVAFVHVNVSNVFLASALSNSTLTISYPLGTENENEFPQ